MRYAFSCSQKVTSAERALISSLLDKLDGLGGAMRKTVVQKVDVCLGLISYQVSIYIDNSVLLVGHNCVSFSMKMATKTCSIMAQYMEIRSHLSDF